MISLTERNNFNSPVHGVSILQDHYATPIMPVFRKKEDLSVVCFLWNNWCHNWGTRYVNKLYRAVQRHLSLPYRFICFTDTKIPELFDKGIELMPMDVPDWKWNLKKMLLYKPNNGLTGRVLCLDLDIIILGSIDNIARYNEGFITCLAPYKKHKRRIGGGSIMGFDAGYGEERLWNPLLDEKEYKTIEKITRGSERMYYRRQLRGVDVRFWDDVFPGQIMSYKREVGERCNPPSEVKIIWFHGKPRPHERLELLWVRDNWI